jgi:hypothetical protein
MHGRWLFLLLLLGASLLCASGPVVFNDDGGWCWYQDERVIVVDGRLVIGSVASGRDDPRRRGNIEVVSYDIASGAMQRFTLHEGADERDRRQWYDDHNTPAFVRTASGHLVAAYAKHGPEEKIYLRRSLRPGDATAWAPAEVFVPSPSSRVTYSNLLRLSAENAPGGRIYNFYRGLNNSFKPSWMWSDDDGTAWRSGGLLIDVPSEVRHRPYVKYAGNGRDTIHFAYTEGHPRDFDNSIYHAMYRDGQIRRSDGTPVAALKDGMKRPEDGTRVFAGSPDRVAWIIDLELDNRGHPYLVYSVQMNDAGKPPGHCGQDHRYRYARFDGKRWHDVEIARAGSCLYPREDDYTGLVALDPEDPRTVFISTNVDPVTGAPLVSKADGQQHWEIFRGATRDFRRWQWTPVTQDSRADNLRPVVPSWPGRQRALLWLEGRMKTYTDYDFRVVGLIGKR